MTLASMSSDNFLKLLQANGYTILDSQYWDLEGVSRIVLGKDGHNFPFRLGQGQIKYFEVANKCKTLGITNVPVECIEEFENCMKASKQYPGAPFYKTQYKNLSLDDFCQLINGVKFTVDTLDTFYEFKDGMLLDNNTPVAPYEFYEEDGVFNLRTPHINKNGDLRIDFEDQSPLVLNLCAKESGDKVAVLMEHAQ